MSNCIEFQSHMISAMKAAKEAGIDLFAFVRSIVREYADCISTIRECYTGNFDLFPMVTGPWDMAVKHVAHDKICAAMQDMENALANAGLDPISTAATENQRRVEWGRAALFIAGYRELVEYVS